MDSKKLPRVLIVDDEPIIREVLIAALSDMQLLVTEADCGEKALEHLKSGHFDVVLTDITMAKVSGIDLLFKAKEISPETEVILITGYASLETAEAAVAGKAYRYLRKPFNDIEDVVSVVQEALDSSRHMKEERRKVENLISQRNCLEKKVGQLETMYSISHATSFPEDTSSLLREIAKILSQVLPLDFLACFVDPRTTGEMGGLYVVFTRPFQREISNRLISSIQRGNACERLCVEEISARSEDPLREPAEILEIGFPRRSSVGGMLYAGHSGPKPLGEEDAQLLEVTAAQLIGAVGKMIDFRGKERERWQTLIESMMDGVILLQQDLSIGMANHSAFEMLGAQSLEDISRKLAELKLDAKIQKAQQGKWTLGQNIEVSGRMLSATVLPFQNRWGSVSMTILRDTTEHFKMQRELERTRRLSMIGELAAGVVHELNTPLTIILGFAQLIMDQPIPEQIKGDMQNILEESLRCQKIIRNLLELAPSRNQQKAPCDIRSVVDKTLELKGPELRKAKIKVLQNLCEEPLVAQIDSGQIQQVLLNLVKNAQDAMEGQERPKHLEISTVRCGDRACVSVADTGTGIPEENLEQIFNPFFTTKPPQKGSGLGLSISHKIMREHEGRLHCKNRPQGGAEFTVELPLWKAGGV